MSADAGSALVAYALLVTAVVFAAAAIANNNLQDLKTGQLVDATPWKQQVALVDRRDRRRCDHPARSSICSTAPTASPAPPARTTSIRCPPRRRG